jgi:hypothetical protein
MAWGTRTFHTEAQRDREPQRKAQTKTNFLFVCGNGNGVFNHGKHGKHGN